MRCPYCVEEISEEAIVCRWCTRDLAFFPSINQRVKALEDRISELENRLVTVAASPTGNSDAVGTKTPLFYIPLAVLGGVLLDGSLGFILELSRSYQAYEWLIPILVVYTIPSILLGFWLSYKQRIAWKLAIAIGAIASALNAGGVYAGFRAPSGYVLNDVWDGFTVALFFSSLALFLSSFWLGGWMARRMASKHTEGQFLPTAGGLGKALLTRGKSETQDTFDDRVRKLNSLISALAPILTFVGSIIVALLGLLGLLATANKGVAPK